ncbi:hypothetical protein ACFL1Y_01220 [Patescibacteria group bacterium]
MTLILSAICKDGVCVCADKRNTESDGTSKDNLNKLYLFSNLPLIIYNHGVNKFNNKMWNEYCTEYERSNRWNNLNFHKICEDFGKFIKKDIEKQLKQNFNKGLVGSYLNSGFVFCGKSDYNTIFKIYELFWSHESQVERHTHGNLVRSGTGDKYLERFFKDNPINTNEYWEKLDIVQTKKELQEIFLNAVVEKNKLGGDEFSDNFDIECISDN